MQVPRLPPNPELDWSDRSAPRAAAFGDVYFSPEDGLAEAETVFVGGCDLPGAWRGKDRFAICELGFGTGLNVLAAWRAWKKTRSTHAILHVSSIEAFPLAKADAARALSKFPEIVDLAAALIECWPVRAYAPQRLWFPNDGFALTLFTGEAEAILAGLSARFNAWFLDGFAPARNPAMWSEAVFAQIARLSAPDAPLATFTVAGHVRRGLETAGFEVEKKPGFGLKRERLEARFPPPFTGEVRAKRGEGVSKQVSAQHPLSHRATRAASSPVNGGANIYPYAACHPKRVAIIGGGIAGAACAHALARRSIETVVLDAAPSLGAGASGNPAGLVMPRLDRGGALREFFLAAYLDAIATYEALGESVFTRCGVEERARDALVELLADPPLPADWFSALPNGAALHARAGLVRPQAAIVAFLRGAELMLEAPVDMLERAGEGWVLRAPDGRAMLKADAIVLACGASLTSFEPARFLPIELSRGQIEWGRGQAPARAITQGSYVAPFDGGVLFGATFDRVGIAGEAPAVHDSRARNLAALAQLAPELAASIDPTKLSSRAALRATMPDFAPVAGLLPDVEAWLSQYAGLAHGRSPAASAPPPAYAGVYVIGALGARGLTLAPLLGERIASEMCGEPPALSQAALDAIHPARFLRRALKRR